MPDKSGRLTSNDLAEADEKRTGYTPPVSVTERVDLLEKIGQTLRGGRVGSVYFLVCRVGRDSGFSQAITNRLGVKAGFNKDYFGHREKDGGVTGGNYLKRRDGSSAVIAGTESLSEVPNPAVEKTPAANPPSESKK